MPTYYQRVCVYLVTDNLILSSKQGQKLYTYRLLFTLLGSTYNFTVKYDQEINLYIM